MGNNLKYNNIGNTDIKVSGLCFGTLTVSPLQCNQSVKEAASLFCYAIDSGINFFDTANLYQTYAPLKETVKYNKDIVIATKDYCYDEKTAEESLNRALKGIGRDFVDIFLIHEQESENTITGHWEAIEYLVKRKQKGDIRAVGLSTHFIKAVEAGTKYNEIEIIHPIYNKKGLGIADGNADNMKSAIYKAIGADKGIYLMKALGGGHLINDAENAIAHCRKIEGVSSIAIGMKDKNEVAYNVELFSGSSPSLALKNKLDNTKRRLMIHDWCTACGRCVSACDRGALAIYDNKAEVDNKKCVLCGYCAPRCPEFCIKVI